MAGKTKPMSQIKQLLRMHKNGDPVKGIARELKMSKNTVKAYLEKLARLPNSIDELLKLEDPVLEARFHSGSPSYKPESRYEALKEQFEYLEKELKKTGVTRQLLWEEYTDGRPDAYSYSQFCFHLQQHQKASRGYMVLDHKPADQLYIDFAGQKTSYTDLETGEEVECSIFVACLPHSDYGFAMAVPSQTLPDFLHALEQCLRVLGGVPLALVPDNMKTAVIKSGYEPTLNRALEDFANHYQTTIYPTRVRRPQDKALVENQVKLVYSRVFARLRNQKFFSLSSLNEAIAEKMARHNQTRMQNKDYCRQERFLSNEKPLLKPLPAEPFEIKYYAELTVLPNNYVHLKRDRRYYSCPFAYLGQKVKVIYTRSMVRIYAKGELIAVHQRSLKPGYSTVEDHLCSTHKTYKNRSPEQYTKKAYNKSAILGYFVEQLFQQGRYPETVYNSCEGIFSLYRKTQKETFEKACQIAIDNQLYSYKHFKNIVENNMANQEKPQPAKPLPEHGNIRGKQYYQTLLNFE
jgi:transposase